MTAVRDVNLLEQRTPYKFCVLFLLFAFGCGSSDGTGRIPLTGNVRLSGDAELRFDGSVSFLPTGGTKAPSATSAVANGKYAFDGSNGPLPGRYQAVIQSRAQKNVPTTDGVTTAKQKHVWTFDDINIAAESPYKRDFTLD